jgi:hypothetical protein
MVRRAVYGSTVLVAFVVAMEACFPPSLRNPTGRSDPDRVSTLWQIPSDLTSRDLFHGPGGRALAPDPSAEYTFLAADRSGFSAGYEVEGPDGTRWSVKLDVEAQPEVVSSRVLWAIGYHQPPTYYLASWNLVGKLSGPQPPGRFRPDLPDRKVVGDWSFFDNEFLGTPPFQGLIVTNLILNNWDWKDSNNKIYELRGTNNRAPERVYVVRDLGASLGKTKFPTFLKWLPMRGFGQGTRNDLAGFEEQGFIRDVSAHGVKFHYRGIYGSLVDTVSANDVRWACGLLAQLTDQQWGDAFRAAGYTADRTGRYVSKIKAKISEGLKLSTPTTTLAWARE